MNKQIHPTTVAAALPFSREEDKGQKGRKRGRKGNEEGRDRKEVREGDGGMAEAPQQHLLHQCGTCMCIRAHSPRMAAHTTYGSALLQLN